MKNWTVTLNKRQVQMHTKQDIITPYIHTVFNDHDYNFCVGIIYQLSLFTSYVRVKRFILLETGFIPCVGTFKLLLNNHLQKKK